MEFNIAKIIDGIFVGNTTALTDYDFILNNKISHLIIWTQNQCLIQLQGVKNIYLHKKCIQPTLEDIKIIVQTIEAAREEFLCCFISCDRIHEALLLLIPFFMNKFCWSIDTTTGFFSQKILPDEISNLLDQVSQIQSNDPSWSLLSKDIVQKDIMWSEEFLKNYKVEDYEQLIIINTVKNISISVPFFEKEEKGKGKKKKRIQWYDRIPKNSINAGERLFGNSRINHSLKKNSNIMVLGLKQSLCKAKELNGGSSGTMKSQERGSSAKKMALTRSATKENNYDDFQYLALKELSRTNFDDMKFKVSKLRKRVSMKNVKGEEYEKSEVKKKGGNSQSISNLKRKHNSNKFLNDLKKIGYFTQNS